MTDLLRAIIYPLLKSQIRLYVLFGLLAGLYQLFLFIKYQELKLFGLGLIKGTLFGMGIGVVTGLVLKEICKMKKNQNSKGEIKYNNVET